MIRATLRLLLQGALTLAAVAVISAADYDAALHERACELRYPGRGVATWIEGAARGTAETAGKVKEDAVNLWRKVRGAPPRQAQPAEREAEDLLRTRDLALLATAREGVARTLFRLHLLFLAAALALVSASALPLDRRRLSFDLAFVAALCLATGWSAPVIILDVETSALDYSVKHFSRSLLDTVRLCFTSGETAVGLLLVLFTFLTPAGKLLLALERLLVSGAAERARADLLLRTVGKWSMVDVFVAALVVFYAKSGSTAGFFIERASFGTGFRYFLAYCLVSALLLHLDPFAGETAAPAA